MAQPRTTPRAPAARHHGGDDAPSSVLTERRRSAPPSTPRRSGRLVWASVVLLTVLALGAVLWRTVLRDTRPDVVAAWRTSNAIWAGGDFEKLCTTAYALGPAGQGMYPDVATCVAGETNGYSEWPIEQRQGLAALSVDPSAVSMVTRDLAVIRIGKAMNGDQPQTLFDPTDLIVMRRLDGAWRQAGARYSGVLIGYLPAQWLKEQGGPTPATPTASSTSK